MAVVTPLMKRDLPLINYATLDYMEGYVEDGLRYITKIIGRMNDVIYHADGSITEWGNMSVVMNYTPEVVAYRIIQEELGKIHILLVPHPDLADADRPRVTASISEGLARVFDDPTMEVTFEWVPDIPSDANGKLRVIVNKVKRP
jgi:phenylacetate-coenzyme A ligase PaaK-like adenylate-forming protein